MPFGGPNPETITKMVAAGERASKQGGGTGIQGPGREGGTGSG